MTCWKLTNISQSTCDEQEKHLDFTDSIYRDMVMIEVLNGFST